MLQNAYFLAKIGADTAENEQHFAEIDAVAVIIGAEGWHLLEIFFARVRPRARPLSGTERYL